VLRTDLPRSSRLPKLGPHRFFPDYDASLYIDATVLLKVPPEEIFDALLSGRTETMACLRNDVVDTLYAEGLGIIRHGYDRADICREQIAAYVRDGYAGTGVQIWTGMLLRYHNNPRVSAFMEKWFAHVLRYSRRDQLSFPYLAETERFPFLCHDLPINETQWHVWPAQDRSDRRAYWETAITDLGPSARRIAELERDLALVRTWAEQLCIERDRLSATFEEKRHASG
jgi:hypothetical protein